MKLITPNLAKLLRSVTLTLHACMLAASGARKKPNILFLLSDDHSYPLLSCYGDANVTTPNIDKLAAEGMKFHRYYTAAPQCVPSRASLMTGRSPVAARITRFSSPLPREETIYPEMLREQAGYVTGILGRSYHLDGSSRSPEVMKFYADKGMKTFTERVDFLKPCGDEKVPETLDEFLGTRGEKPFYAWANFSDPHHVWTKGREKRPDPAKLKLPAHWPDLPSLREEFADYCAEINNLDDSVGKVLQVLEKHGVKEETLIIFTGDNGAALPRGKGSLHDMGCHVPLVVRWPGVVPAGTESRALLSGEDFAPTLLEAAGIEVPKRITGQSFLTLLQGKPHTPRTHVFTERGPHGSAASTEEMYTNALDLSRAVTSDRYRLIYNNTPWIRYAPVDSSNGPGWLDIKAAHAAGTLDKRLSQIYFAQPRPVYELYDLEKDPAELQNLSGKPEVAEVERNLRIALAEKMIIDFDYLPLPHIPSLGEPEDAKQGPGGPEAARATRFKLLDKDGNGQLSESEFIGGSKDAAAQKERFQRRDLDKNGTLSRTEFLPQAIPN